MGFWGLWVFVGRGEGGGAGLRVWVWVFGEVGRGCLLGAIGVYTLIGRLSDAGGRGGSVWGMLCVSAFFGDFFVKYWWYGKAEIFNSRLGLCFIEFEREGRSAW